MINFFAICVIILLVLQIVCVILGYVYQAQAESAVDKVVLDVVKGYNTSKTFREFMDTTQTDLHCCGGDNYTDYKTYGVFNTSHVPLSCCKVDRATCNTKIDTLFPTVHDYYEEGCSRKVIDYLTARLGIVAGVAVAVCFIQLLAIIFACCLSKNIDSYQMV